MTTTNMPSRWLFSSRSSVRPSLWRDSEGRAQYWAKLVSEEITTPGASWEETTFGFTAAKGSGPSIVRQVIKQGPMTSVEVFERCCCIGSPDFAQIHAGQGGR
jgi:hypothetical protein